MELTRWHLNYVVGFVDWCCKILLGGPGLLGKLQALQGQMPPSQKFQLVRASTCPVQARSVDVGGAFPGSHIQRSITSVCH